MSETTVIYSDGSQECERMASLLKSMGGEFLEYELGTHFTREAFHGEFGKEATFPQVTIGVNHIGNMNETLKYMSSRGMFV